MDTVHIASGVVDGSFIQPFKVTWKKFPKTATGKSLASNLVQEKVELVDVEGRSLLKFTQVCFSVFLNKDANFFAIERKMTCKLFERRLECL